MTLKAKHLFQHLLVFLLLCAVGALLAWAVAPKGGY